MSYQIKLEISKELGLKMKKRIIISALPLLLIVFLTVANACTASEEQLVPVQASTILENISKGLPVELDCAIIEGDLDLGQISLRDASEVYSTLESGENSLRVVESPIKISSSSINGRVIFSNVIFNSPIDFTNTTFCHALFFSNDIFREHANFINAHFRDDTYFVKSQFCGGAYFRLARFDKYAGFSMTEFQEVADFRNAIFIDGAEFQDAGFLEKAKFWQTSFRRGARFTNDIFNKDAEFWGARFEDDADFEGAKFEENVFFNDYPSLKLEGAQFNKSLMLNNTKIYNLDLKCAQFGSKSRISLTGSSFERVNVWWDDIKDHLVYDGAVFLAFVKSFKEMEHFEDADDCYYQYRRLSQSEKDFGVSKLVDLIAWLSCGYGVRPLFTVGWMIGLIILFGTVFSMEGVFEKSGSCITPSMRDGMEIRSSTKDRPNPFYFSLIVFTFQSRGEMRPEGLYKYLAVFEGILGLLLFGLFVVTLTNVMIR